MFGSNGKESSIKHCILSANYHIGLFLKSRGRLGSSFPSYLRIFTLSHMSLAEPSCHPARSSTQLRQRAYRVRGAFRAVQSLPIRRVESGFPNKGFNTDAVKTPRRLAKTLFSLTPSRSRTTGVVSASIPASSEFAPFDCSRCLDSLCAAQEKAPAAFATGAFGPALKATLSRPWPRRAPSVLRSPSRRSGSGTACSARTPWRTGHGPR